MLQIKKKKERRKVQELNMIARYLRVHSSDISALGHGARVTAPHDPATALGTVE